MSDEDRYWSVRLIVYAFESEDEAREYQHKLVDAFCAMPESADLASSAGYFEGSSFDELSRLRAEVERLTVAHDSICGKLAGVITALADERRHADALAEALTTFIEGGNRQLALISRKVRVTDPMTLTVTKGQLLAAIEARAAHRARRQGAKLP